MGCWFSLFFGGLQTWLLLWATWDHPHFWFIQLIYWLLAVLNGVVSWASTKPV